MAAWFDSVGSVAALCTTLCWLPQSIKIIREKRTEGISLITQSVFTFGTALWATYGLLLNNQPVLYANAVTLVFALTILILKIRYPLNFPQREIPIATSYDPARCKMNWNRYLLASLSEILSTIHSCNSVRA